MGTRTQRTFYVISTGALIAFGMLVWYRVSLARQVTQTARPLPLVQVTKPAQLEMLRKLVLTADILPIQQADLMAKMAGYLDAIYVDRGDRVHSGQLLAVIRQPELEQQLYQAQANHDLAKVTFERLQELYAKQLIAKQEVDDSRTKFEVAKRTLDLQHTYLNYAQIVAPFDGYVTKRYVDPGAFIPQATGVVSTVNTILTVMDLSQVKVLVNVPERDVGSVHVGDQLSLTLDAYPDRTFPGQVTKFSPALDSGSRTLQVEIDVPNADLALKPGMFARVVLVLERHLQALAVPSETLLVNELGSFIFAIGPTQSDVPTVRRVAVRTGIEDGGQVEILGGLGPNDQVVRTGKELVHDGGGVRVAGSSLTDSAANSDQRERATEATPAAGPPAAGPES
jgi:membrane fusion protein (multidrug efflux system)